eukprot:5330749-Pyramimonas_sp.AAC.1
MDDASTCNNCVGDEHLCALLQDARAGMWATSRGPTRLAQPRTGTRPGIPASDLAIKFALPKLRDI